MNLEKGTFDSKFYNDIFSYMREYFGEPWHRSIPPVRWNIWRKRIKENFFEKDILIEEIIKAIPEASEKSHWPRGDSFWKRVEDICFLHRRERPWTTKIDTGLSGIADTLKNLSKNLTSKMGTTSEKKEPA